MRDPEKWSAFGAVILIFCAEAVEAQSSEATLSRSGCACSWDPLQQFIDPDTNQPYDCACCIDDPDVVQCGYPKSDWCRFKDQDEFLGCKGDQNIIFLSNIKFLKSDIS